MRLEDVYKIKASGIFSSWYASPAYWKFICPDRFYKKT